MNRHAQILFEQWQKLDEFIDILKMMWGELYDIQTSTKSPEKQLVNLETVLHALDIAEKELERQVNKFADQYEKYEKPALGEGEDPFDVIDISDKELLDIYES